MIMLEAFAKVGPRYNFESCLGSDLERSLIRHEGGNGMASASDNRTKNILTYLYDGPVEPIRSKPYLYCWDVVHNTEDAEHCCPDFNPTT
jgi:hypothetical protein